MAIPSVDITIKDGGLGLTGGSSVGIPAFVGRIAEDEFIDRRGTEIDDDARIGVGVPSVFATEDALVAACGTGVLAQAAATALAAGASAVVVCRAADDDEEASPAVTFQTAVKAAAEALADGDIDFEVCEIVCDRNPDFDPSTDSPDYDIRATQGLSPAQINALVPVLDTIAGKLWAAHDYGRCLFQVEAAAPDNPAQGLTGITVSSPYVSVALGHAVGFDYFGGQTQLNPIGWAVAARACAVSIGTDLARFTDGPLTGLSACAPGGDEAKMGGINDGRNITTVRTFPRQGGVYITNARILAPEGSDIRFWQHRRILNQAACAAYDHLLTLLSRQVRVDRQTGRIDPSTASSIEGNLVSAIVAAIGASVTGVDARVDRTVNILSTNTLLVSVGIIPFGYLKTIECTIGFENPGLQAV